jgi:hypothetical protein
VAATFVGRRTMIFAFATFAVETVDLPPPNPSESDVSPPARSPCTSAASSSALCSKGVGHGNARIGCEDARGDAVAPGAEGRAVSTNYRPCA